MTSNARSNQPTTTKEKTMNITTQLTRSTSVPNDPEDHNATSINVGALRKFLDGVPDSTNLNLYRHNFGADLNLAVRWREGQTDDD